MDPHSEKMAEILEDCIGGGGGSIIADCGCGITYFVSDGDYEENELEGLQAKAIEDPKKYIEWGDCNYVSTVEIGGRRYVRGCSCGWQQRYSNFVWYNRQVITRFLKKVVADIAQEAEQEVKLISEMEASKESESKYRIGTEIKFSAYAMIPWRNGKEFELEKKADNGVIVGVYNQGACFLVYSHGAIKYIDKQQIVELVKQTSVFELLTGDNETIREIVKHHVAIESKYNATVRP